MTRLDRQSSMSARSTIVAISVALLALGGLPSMGQEAQATSSTVVHLSHFDTSGNELHRTVMALKMACALKEKGDDVTLFLDLRGPRLVDREASLDIRWGRGGSTVGDLYDRFLDAGGRVVVCAHCARSLRLEASQLRAGAALVATEEFAARLIESDRILDY